MKVVDGLKNLKKPIRGSVVTIGVFDCVHIGHNKIIDLVVSRARTLGLKSVVVTFDPHPAKVFSHRSSAPSLISLDHRERLIAERGVDILVVVKFTRRFAGVQAKDFLRDVVWRRLGAKIIYAGRNFYFGRRAWAGSNELKMMAHPLGIKVVEVKPARVDGGVASSSLAREKISRGDLTGASRILGRPVSVLGTVAGGSRLARSLGYPTANINPNHEAVPPSGVYAAMVRLGRKSYKGIVNIGVRPTFYAPRDRETSIEVHIFNFHGDIYGKDLEVLFIKKIRDEIRFSGRDELIQQIRRDERAARKLLKKLAFTKRI